MSSFLCFILWQSRQRAGLPFRNTSSAHFKSNLAYVVTIPEINLKHWTLSPDTKRFFHDIKVLNVSLSTIPVSFYSYQYIVVHLHRIKYVRH